MTPIRTFSPTVLSTFANAFSQGPVAKKAPAPAVPSILKNSLLSSDSISSVIIFLQNVFLQTQYIAASHRQLYYAFLCANDSPHDSLYLGNPAVA
jgi:hypothetical protein